MGHWAPRIMMSPGPAAEKRAANREAALAGFVPGDPA